MNWLPNPCRRCREGLSLLAGSATSGRGKVEIERHLADCADCRSHYEQLKDLTTSLAEFRNSAAEVEPTAMARQKWARAIRAASRPARAEAGNLKQPAVRWWHEFFGRGRLAWGGIAAVWLVMWAVNWGRPESHTQSGADAAATPVVTQTFEEERRLLAELIPPTDREPVEAPRRKPSPRSEAQRSWLIG